MADGGELQEAWSGELFPAKPAPKARPHYHGHRDRLRDRTRAGGFSGLPDYEFQELYLFKRTVISSTSALSAYVRTALAHEAREQFRALFIDKKNQLIADEVLNHGTVDHAPVYPREVMRRALELSASALILVHNHPSGDPTPSGADVQMTREIVEAGRSLRIAIHDHLVVGRDGVASFKALGLF
ncbi:RadC family protein [Phenylobacterium sp.]|uniref:JAB domain-containing protein n=1 Tax=Phenylobacterium sp. TaxID=1871053 RepID=UPI002737E19C|nr:DNA repair protein RadC [Phenylobacterium sp.]MDP3868386.1 DNA repair protein RadC [Phenylobacterium sp.]